MAQVHTLDSPSVQVQKKGQKVGLLLSQKHGWPEPFFHMYAIYFFPPRLSLLLEGYMCVQSPPEERKTRGAKHHARGLPRAACALATLPSPLQLQSFVFQNKVKAIH